MYLFASLNLWMICKMIQTALTDWFVDYGECTVRCNIDSEKDVPGVASQKDCICGRKPYLQYRSNVNSQFQNCDWSFSKILVLVVNY